MAVVSWLFNANIQELFMENVGKLGIFLSVEPWTMSRDVTLAADMLLEF